MSHICVPNISYSVNIWKNVLQVLSSPHPFTSQRTAVFTCLPHFLFKLSNVLMSFSENYVFLLRFIFGVVTLPTMAHRAANCDYPPFFPLLYPHILQKCLLTTYWICILPHLNTNCRRSYFFFFTWLIRTDLELVFLLQDHPSHNTQTSARMGFLKFTPDPEAGLVKVLYWQLSACRIK